MSRSEEKADVLVEASRIITEQIGYSVTRPDLAYSTVRSTRVPYRDALIEVSHIVFNISGEMEDGVKVRVRCKNETIYEKTHSFSETEEVPKFPFLPFWTEEVEKGKKSVVFDAVMAAIGFVDRFLEASEEVQQATIDRRKAVLDVARQRAERRRE